MKALQMNVLTLVGVGVGFLGTAFVVTWMLQGHLSPGDKMWATIIVCSTTAVMFVFIGELNRREANRLAREAERDAERDEVLRKELKKIKEEFFAELTRLTDAAAAKNAQELARLHASQQHTTELLEHLLSEIGLDKVKRANWAAGWVASADQEGGGGSGVGKLHLLPAVEDEGR